MFPKLRTLATSLEVRLLAPLAVIITVVLSLHAGLGRWAAREELQQFVLADLERSTSLVQGAMHDEMLLNRMRELQARIERLGTSPGFTGIRVYGKDGRVVLAADRSEVGKVLSVADSACVPCHTRGEVSGPGVRSGVSLVHSRDGRDAPRSLKLIRNEAACAAKGCHPGPWERPVLGVLDVQMTMEPFDAAISRAGWQMGWTTVLLVLATGLIVALLVRHQVHGPVARLREGTRQIAAGDLGTRIEVTGARELEALGSAFNTMVADLRSARDELDRWSRTLEERVEEKTRALRAAQQQMSRVETMASLGKLSATVAHEINNPLSGILTYARLVRRELATQPIDAAVRAELESYLTLVDSECVRCGDIVKNLLAFARQRGGRPGPTDLNQIVEHSLMLVRHHLEINRVRLEKTMLDGDPTIFAVAGEVQQTVLALLMNAIEAMHANGDRPAVLEVALRAEGESVLIVVRDTGSGIPPELIPHIFEPFVTTKGEAKGVGLGLSVVYGVVHRHGGTIDVRSRQGEGTVFAVTLPRRGVAERSDDARPELAEVAP